MNTVFTWWIVGEFITLVPKIDTATVQIYHCSMLTNIVYTVCPHFYNQLWAYLCAAII